MAAGVLVLRIALDWRWRAMTDEFRRSGGYIFAGGG